MRLTKSNLVTALVLFTVFVITLTFILNLYLDNYELEEKLLEKNEQMRELYAFYSKHTNISFAIAYALSFFDTFHELPTIYVITPTNNRRVAQMADLTRMRNTLWLVPKLVWILVEDSPLKSNKMAKFLDQSRMPFVHLNAATPDDFVVKSNEKSWSKPRGVLQRNKGIAWLREHADQLERPGVVYFADDDNTYDVRLFEEMRYTQTVSVWPVAFVGEILYERPICNNGKVLKWFCVWGNNRPFPIDMAGFAVNLKLLLAHPSASFSLFAKRGMQESHFLTHLVRLEDLEAKADNCTKIYVWHTNTRAVLLKGELDMQNRNMVYDEDIVEQF